jgi:hypothetical protein
VGVAVTVTISAMVSVSVIVATPDPLVVAVVLLSLALTVPPKAFFWNANVTVLPLTGVLLESTSVTVTVDLVAPSATTLLVGFATAVEFDALGGPGSRGCGGTGGVNVTVVVAFRDVTEPILPVVTSPTVALIVLTCETVDTIVPLTTP